MKLIGITGADKSGKTTFAHLLLSDARKRGVPAYHWEMSEPIVAELARQLGKTREHILEHKELYRDALVWWAQSFKKKFEGNDYYAKQARAFVDAKSLRGCLVIVSGIRFPVDAKVISDYKGVLVEISKSSSSIELKEDMIITNNSTLKTLKEKAEKLMTLIYDN